MPDLLDDMPISPAMQSADAPIPPPPGSGLTPPSNATPASTPPPPFPPPAPNTAAGTSQRSFPVVWATLCAVAALAAVGFALLWTSASNRADDAERDAAQAEVERDAATQNLLENEVELQTLRDELEAQDAAASDAGTEPEAPADDAELEATITDLEEEIERLTTENAELTAATEAGGGADPDASPEESPVPPTGAAAFDATTTPAFAQYIGELLSSNNGGSQLGPEQSQCFGAAVINDIGVEALGAGLNNDSTSPTNNAVIGAMQDAAAACGINPALIFG